MSAVSQAPTTRSRPGSFIEQSQLFIHPPPSGAAGSSMTWSNASPQIELLAGISATPPLSSQPVNPVQRFQVSSVCILFCHVRVRFLPLNPLAMFVALRRLKFLRFLDVGKTNV